MSDGWISNIDAAGVARFLAGKHHVVVLTHTKPDGDAVGSSVAIARALNIEAGGGAGGFSGVASRAEAWYVGPLPGWIGAVVGDLKHRRMRTIDDVPPVEPDAIVITDTGSWNQLDPLGDWLRPRADRIVLLDHHLRGDAEVSPRRLIETTAAAACEIAAGVCTRILGVKGPAALPIAVAEPLYLGLATDTGWFRHSNVTATTLRLAADLIELGVDHERLLETIEHRERVSRIRLMARALAGVEYLRDDTIAVMALRPSDFEAAGASPGESGGFLDLLRTVESVRVAALLTETKGEGDKGVLTKISLRSKGGHAMVDVNEVASKLGGGGHAQAAGARLPLPLAEAKARLLEAIP